MMSCISDHPVCYRVQQLHANFFCMQLKRVIGGTMKKLNQDGVDISVGQVRVGTRHSSMMG